ncbi:MAG: TonB-dependent receptor [Cloacibacterium sp.]|nr:TonB-dependent receptor [Cloacibacterium sp.]
MIRLEFISNFRKKTLGLTFLLGITAMAFAQEKQGVKGRIVDEANQGVPYASVEFKHKTNKVWSDATLTDEKGNFSITLTKGSYDITVDAIQFKKITLAKQIDGASDLGNIKIETDGAPSVSKTKDIEGVTITATSKQPYKIELDKKVYSVDQDLTAKGGNLQTVLNNVPSVNVDADGSVSMRGNANVKFLINGKPSSILGITNDNDALKNIPADQIERIEVITNPSSKFEASGTAGILNIILKQSKGLGFNGSVEGSIGYLPQSRLNTNLSWNYGKLTWFVNGGGGFGRMESNSTTFQEFYARTTDGIYFPRDIQDISMKMKNDFKNYNVNTGLNYNFTEKTSVNASVNINTNKSDSDINTSKNSSITKLSNRISLGNGENNNIQFDAGLEHKFNNKGHLFALSGSYQDSDNNSTERLTDNEYGIQNFAIENTNTQKTWIAKADYELPIGEKSKLEAGARYDDRNSVTDNKYAETTNNTYVPIKSGTSTIDYIEKISAFYVQFKSKFDKFGYQLGVRNENTGIDINYSDLDQQNQKTSKNYSGFFPTVFLSYNLTDNSQISLNYSKRINRPRGFQLIPTQRIQNKSSRFQGNADLNPSYVNSFELGYNYSKGSKITLNPTLYYQRTNDDINMTVREMTDTQTGERYNLTMPANIGTEDRYGLDFNYNYNANKWLRLFGNFNLFGYNNESSFDGKTTKNEGFSTQIRLTASVKLDKTTNMQLQGNYNGPVKTFQNERLPMYVANFGLNKNIWNNQGTLNLSVQDIFNSRRRRATTQSETFYREMNMQMMPRTIMLSLSYRFKNKDAQEIKTKPRRQEQSRDFGGDDGPM